MCSPPSPGPRIPASTGAADVRVGVDQGMLGGAYAVQGVLVGTEQPAGVSRRAQQVGALAQGGVVLGGDEEGVAVPGDDLDRVVVLVDLLDQREESLACLARGDRHDNQPSKSGTTYSTTPMLPLTVTQRWPRAAWRSGPARA